jgi:hypothetical protein
MRSKALVLSIGALIAVVTVDYATGYEFMFHTFYSIPVSIAAWSIGRRAALAMAVAGGLAWWFADAASGHHYSHAIYGVWNAFICFLSFAAGGILLAQLRKSLTESERKSAELKAALDELQRSTLKVRELQDNMVVMCAWTKQIREEGRWISVEEFLSRHLNMNLSHGISPEGLRELAEQPPEAAVKEAKS